MKTMKEYTAMKVLRDKVKRRGLPARIEAICQREVTQRSKTFIRDPLDLLLRMGKIRGHKVG
jgi:hypothetical protein